MSLLPARFPRVFAGGFGPLLGLGLAILFGSQVLTSCGSDDDPSCDPGDEKDCPAVGCPNDTGTQVCQDDGTYTACDCTGGSAGSGGSSGAAGSSGVAGSSGASGMGGASMTGDVPRGNVGLPCESAGDCAFGLDCVTSTSDGPFNNGGPANGYCTATCNADEECEALDLLSACALNGGAGTPDDTSDDVRYCIALCQSGAPSATEFKCSLVNGARDDLACLVPGGGSGTGARELGLCVPACHSDAACGNGRFCNLSTGVCNDAAPQGLAIGEACVDNNECAGGSCLELESSRFCTGICTFGLIGGCGFDAEGVPDGERTAACLDPAFQGGGGGDLGFCTQLCDVQSDCAQADWTCEDLTEFGDPSLPQQLGRFGFCSPPPAGDAGAP
jgi:hypothetical protein